MRALHLPGVPSGSTPTFSFPDHPPPPSALVYSASGFPEPRLTAQRSYLVRVLATSLTRGELTWNEVLAPSRFESFGGAIPGHELVGVVEEVLGSPQGVTLFKEGDQVWGLVDFDRDSAAAEYVVALEDELSLAPRCPEDIQAEQWVKTLATLPLSALTAWQALFVHGGLLDHGKKSNGPRQLTILGSGAVARALLELAAQAGVCPRVVAFNTGAAILAADYVPSHIPASQVIEDGPNLFQELTSIDAEDAKMGTQPVDLIIDTIGGPIVAKLLTSTKLNKLFKSGGKFVTIAAPISALGTEAEQAIKMNLTAAGVSCQFFIVKPCGEQLQRIGNIVEMGKLSGCVDSFWSLEQGREAMEKVERRGAVNKGKIVLTI